MTRSGKSFSAYYSTNGTTWVQIGAAQTLSGMGTFSRVGLAVTSHNNASLCQATFTNVAALSGTFSDLDIGSPSVGGTAVSNGNQWTVIGSGADIAGTSDQFNFASASFATNGALIAQVDGMQNTDPWAKAGVMFRQTTTANSPFAMVAATPGNGVVFQWRTTSGGTAGSTQIAGVGGAIWVKVARSGTSFSGYYSTDGINWIQIGSAVTIAMPTTIRAGLAVVSHNNALGCSALFANVALGEALGPTGTWLGEGAGTDSSGNGNTLTRQNGAGYVPSNTGFGTQAFRLNGKNQYEQTSASMIDTTKAFSISAWVYWNGQTGTCSIVSQNGTNVPAFFLEKNTDGYFKFGMYATDSNASAVVKASWATKPTPDTWYHLAGVFTGTSVRLYVNGAYVASATVTTKFSAAGPFIIGAAKSAGALTNFFGGKIDNVSVYSYALSDAGVKAIYSNYGEPAGVDFGAPPSSMNPSLKDLVNAELGPEPAFEQGRIEPSEALMEEYVIEYMRQAVLNEIHQWELNVPKYNRFFNWLENQVEHMESEPKLEHLYEELEDFSKAITRRDLSEIRRIVLVKENTDVEVTDSLEADLLDSSWKETSQAANAKSDLFDFDVDMLLDVGNRKFWHKHKKRS